jgi:hypothetical protein
MITIRLVLLILALACFFCAAIGVQSGRVALVPAGLALWVLSLLVV